jgi:methionyl-tRNA synthetase
MSQSYYLTTAISYVNARPHFGHAYEFIASDAIVPIPENERQAGVLSVRRG